MLFDEIRIISNFTLTCSFTAGIVIYLQMIDTYFYTSTKWLIIGVLLILPVYGGMRCIILLFYRLIMCALRIDDMHHDNEKQVFDKLILSNAMEMAPPDNNVLLKFKDYYESGHWNIKSADHILLLLQRNIGKTLDISSQNIDDDGLMLIHFFLTFNKKFKNMITGFDLLDNAFTEEGFVKFCSAIESLYGKDNCIIETYCGSVIQQVYENKLRKTLLINEANIGTIDLYIIGHTLLLGGK